MVKISSDSMAQWIRRWSTKPEILGSIPSGVVVTIFLGLSDLNAKLSNILIASKYEQLNNTKGHLYINLPKFIYMTKEPLSTRKKKQGRGFSKGLTLA